MQKCNQNIIKLRQGDDSNFNKNRIIFHLGSTDDLTDWKAKFTIQNLTLDLPIKNNEVELVLNKEQTNELEIGNCYGWLQLIDTEGLQGTVFAQQFQILKKEVL